MARRTTQKGIQAIRAHFLEAAAEEDRAGILDPDPNLPRNGIKAGKWAGFPFSDMPPECPVRVLGHDREITYCVSATGQLHAVERWDAKTISKLFAPYLNYAYWAWPAYESKGKAEVDEDGNPLPPRVVRLQYGMCADALIQEGARRGLFDPQKYVRGRGGWMAGNGQFIWNSGEWLWMCTKEGGVNKLVRARPGEIDRAFYVRAPDIDRPWATPVPTEESPAQSILADLRSWSWERPYLDPVLYLGWIGCGWMGGALEVRPIVFTTGGAGVGKSTLHALTKALLGDTMIALVDTTAAGIYQHVGHDSRPVAVDELEAKKGSTKATSVIELARLAYSGGLMARGGANHEGTTFEARSAFMFSAILPPPMGVQDRTRMAMLNLKRLNRETMKSAPVVRAEDGPMLLRQIMDGWNEFRTRLLPNWRQVLHMAGFDARTMDTYGTLLAAAELLVGAETLEEMGLDLTDPQRLAEVLKMSFEAEKDEQVEKWLECIEHILSAPVDSHRGGRRLTVGALAGEYRRGTLDLEYVREDLALAGLGLKPAGGRVPGTGPYLCVPKTHQLLATIFRDTDFFDGGWWHALKQAPESIVLRGHSDAVQTIKISGAAKNCLLIDLAAYDRASPEGVE